MGRSSGYCFKIIACGHSSESVDRDDLDASSENKGSVKRGWSFRKRSPSDKVINNTVITEIPSENKNLEPVIINYEAPVSYVSEKIPTNQSPEELTRVSTSTTKGSIASNLVTDDADEDEIKFDSSVNESFAIVIESAVRKDLAQRELAKRKKVVKLQAVIRGHIVRCRAAGALRCIQSIVKMQALVRARHASMNLLEKTSTKKRVKRDSKTDPHPTYVSIEKLLSNRFAMRLLESTPRTKNISIKCDPSEDDSAWKWMERWSSVSSPEPIDLHTLKHEQVKVNDTKNSIENEGLEQKSDFLSDESEHLKTGLEFGPEKPVVEAEQPKRVSKTVASESVFGSRKASNPAFIAAHSRFEELSSKNNLLASINSSNLDQEHVPDKSLFNKPVGSPAYESLKMGDSRTGGSECGTELSVTSMLDSPDPSEVGNIECNKESNSFDNKDHAYLSTELTHSILDPSDKFDCNISSDDIVIEPETGRPMYNSPNHKEVKSQETSTPSSQISNNRKTKKVPTQKPKPWSNSTKSPVTLNHNAGFKNSLEHLHKEPKLVNRRNSFGSQTSEPVDQEPRDSCSSNSLPSYMQITESAKAKALANNSPRSSPDVQSKDAYLKKRRSLPGSVSGKQGSPRAKRASQQNTKGSNNQERKWQN